MKLSKNIFLLLMLSGAIQVLNITPGLAQCGSFMKNKCLPKLKPYVSTEQVFNTTLLTDDKTKTSMTFYYGDEYRILVCADEALGKVQVNLKDKANNIVFTTKGYGTISWDFNVENTQDLTLEVLTPAGKPTEAEKSGCVSIIVGFK